MFEAPVNRRLILDTTITKSQEDLEWETVCRRDDDAEYMATGRVNVPAVIKKLFPFDGDQPIPWLTFTGGAGSGGWGTLVYAKRDDFRREITLTIMTSVPSSIGSPLEGRRRGRTEQVWARYFERIDSKASGSLFLVCRSKAEVIEMVEVESRSFLFYDRARALGYGGVKQWVAQQVVEALFHEILESVMIDNRLAFQAQVEQAHRNGQ